MDLDKAGISVFPVSMLNKLLPDLSPMHRWMHGQFKNWMRDFVNRYAESREMQAILARKLGSVGWVNPEMAALWDILEQLIEKEKILWEAKNERSKVYGEINRNERFWRNFRTLICVMLDEDSYYLLRFFYGLELLHVNYEKFHIENVHKNRAYWNWEEFKLKLKMEAEKSKIKQEGFVFGNEKSQIDEGFPAQDSKKG